MSFLALHSLLKVIILMLYDTMYVMFPSCKPVCYFVSLTGIERPTANNF